MAPAAGQHIPSATAEWPVKVGSEPPSSQGQEQPFELLFTWSPVTGGLTSRHALAQTGRHDLETGPIEGARGCGELREDLGAVAAFFDHANHPSDLALCAAKALYHRVETYTVCIHCRSSRVVVNAMAADKPDADLSVRP